MKSCGLVENTIKKKKSNIIISYLIILILHQKETAHRDYYKRQDSVTVGAKTQILYNIKYIYFCMSKITSKHGHFGQIIESNL